MKLTNNQKRLIDLLKARGFDKDNVIGFLLSLQKDEAIEAMSKWIEKNPKADRDSIFEKWYEIMEIEKP